MNVNFASNSASNSVVVDSATGHHLFELSTPFGLRCRTTTLRDAHRRVVGKYKSGLIHDEVTYQGQTTRVSDWLATKRFLSRSRTFVAPNGRSYQWEWARASLWNDGSLKLTDCRTQQLIARGHRNHTRLFSPSKDLNIDVLPDGLPVLDAIVLSFVICELLTRHQEKAQTRFQDIAVGG